MTEHLQPGNDSRNHYSTQDPTEITLDSFEATLQDIIEQAKAPDVLKNNERRVKAMIANTLERGYYLFREAQMGADEYSAFLYEALGKVGLPDGIDAQDRQTSLPGKRQPTLAESIPATLERYKFTESLPSAFGDRMRSITVGGSMAYGPFFNVRSGNDPSDVDAIMVTDDNFLDSTPWQALLMDTQIKQADKYAFLARMEYFRDMQARGEADVLSQRFTQVNGHFNMSAHFFTPTAYNQVFGEDFETMLEQDRDGDVYVEDYKQGRFERAECSFHGFSGDTTAGGVTQHETDSGVIARIPSHKIANGRFYPGIYQCLLLPEPLLVFAKEQEDADVAHSFSATIRHRVEQERTFNPQATLLNANPRRIILPPGRY